MSLASLALAVSITFGAFSAAGIYLLAKSTGLPRISAASELQSAKVYPRELINETDRQELLGELDKHGITRLTNNRKVLATLRWVMSQTTRIEDNPARGSIELLRSVKHGRGFICGDLADLFREALLVQQVPARRIILHRDVFDNFDTHVAVEVWHNNSWQVFDPTFHVTLESSDGRPVGSYTAQAWFIRAKGDPVAIRFLGDVPYPARITNYSVRYEHLFNNVFVESERGSTYLRAVPLVGPFLAPRWHYPAKTQLSGEATRMYEVLYWTTMVILPSLSLGALALYLSIRIRRSRRT
jgi:hypothetical protein